MGFKDDLIAWISGYKDTDTKQETKPETKQETKPETKTDPVAEQKSTDLLLQEIKELQIANAKLLMGVSSEQKEISNLSDVLRTEPFHPLYGKE